MVSKRQNETTSSHRDPSSRFASPFGEKAQSLGRNANTIRSHVPVPILLQRGTFSGRPAGDAEFVALLEQQLGRPLASRQGQKTPFVLRPAASL